MKRLHVILVAACLCLTIGVVAHAQMGMDFFKRPAISNIFHPVVGAGSVYETTYSRQSSRGAAETTEMLVVGREMADGKDAYWLEFGHQEKGQQGTAYSKVLISKDDFQMHRIIFEMPGQPAMEMKMDMSREEHQKMGDEMSKWSQVGTETITVPAGTFVCQHWKKSDGKSEIWASDKISPFGMVKEIEPNQTQVLVKVITDAKDHITGPVVPFDPKAFGRQKQ
ncbi:MAG: hypothetical protein ACRD51_16690 [Candidatus Acidiferrum sp.]